MANTMNSNRSLIAGAVAAILASTCCVGPLVLLTLGISGAWIGSLAALEPYRPVFMGLTLVFLGLAFRKLYRVPRVCEPGTACANPATLRRQRIVFWAATLVLLALMTFPWYGPLFL